MIVRDSVRSVSVNPTNLPPGEMSNALRTEGGPVWNGLGAVSGFPKANVGCVVTLTHAIWPGAGL